MVRPAQAPPSPSVPPPGDYTLGRKEGPVEQYYSSLTADLDGVPHAAHSRSVARDVTLTQFYHTHTLTPDGPPGRGAEAGWGQTSIAATSHPPEAYASARKNHVAGSNSVARDVTLSTYYGTKTTDLDPGADAMPGRYAVDSIAGREYAGSPAARQAERERRLAVAASLASPSRPAQHPHTPQSGGGRDVVEKTPVMSIARQTTLGSFYGTSPFPDETEFREAPQYSTDSIAAIPPSPMREEDSRVGAARSTLRNVYFGTQTTRIPGWE